MEVYDMITANTVEEGDQILVNGLDPVEVTKVIDSGDAIMVKGYSHITGDEAAYVLTPDTEVGLWTA